MVNYEYISDPLFNVQNAYEFEYHHNIRELFVKVHLPAKQRLELVNKIIDSSRLPSGLYHPYLIKINILVWTAIYYTNIHELVGFDEENLDDLYELYDVIRFTGLEEGMYSKMDSVDVGEIDNMVKFTLQAVERHDNSAAGVIDKVVNELPQVVSNTNESLKEFDTAKYAEIMNMAAGLNVIPNPNMVKKPD